MFRRFMHVAAVVALSLAPGMSARLEQRSPPNGGQAIVGRVTDAAGTAVGGVFVSVLRDEEARPGAPRLHPVDVRFHSVTNQNGEFRLQNLLPDSYAVVALPRNVPLDAQNRPNRTGYGITYYPNATRAGDAKSVMVTRSAGATANITLASTRLSVVSGVVIGSNGKVPLDARLLVGHGDGLFGLGGMAATIRSDGAFAVAGLPPGTYFLHMREGVWPPPRDVIPRVSVAKVRVVDRDVTGVRVEPQQMVRATGRIVVDPAVRASMQPSTIQVAASPVDWQGNPGPSRPGVVRDDLTFEFRVWPALGHVRVFPESEWIVSRVRFKGADVTEAGIDFRVGQDVTGLEVHLTKGPSR